MGTARGTPTQVASDPASDVRADGRDARIPGVVRTTTLVGERARDPRSRIVEPDFTITWGGEAYPRIGVRDLAGIGEYPRVCITGEREKMKGEAATDIRAVGKQGVPMTAANEWRH